METECPSILPLGIFGNSVMKSIRHEQNLNHPFCLTNRSSASMIRSQNFAWSSFNARGVAEVRLLACRAADMAHAARFLEARDRSGRPDIEDELAIGPPIA